MKQKLLVSTKNISIISDSNIYNKAEVSSCRPAKKASGSVLLLSKIKCVIRPSNQCTAPYEHRMTCVI